MNFFRKWNQIFFTKHFNPFDLLVCSIVWPLASSVSFFWILALVPAIVFSAFMETLVEHSRAA
jgi:uncharacterized BrkB/YihY/UPF0761 family membrane protein